MCTQSSKHPRLVPALCWRVCLFAVLVSLLACKPAYITEEKELSDRATSRINPTNLQAWAVTNLSSRSAHEDIAAEDLPSEILNLYDGEPRSYVHTNLGEERCIVISWGSGFGHRGFLIGSSKYRPVIGDNPMYVVEWIPGVYFCSQTR
jgi:hypothetical protein